MNIRPSDHGVRGSHHRGWLKRLTSALRSHVRYRITKSGYLFAAALLLVGAAAVASANNLLFLILAAMLATLLISGVIGRLNLAGLELELTLPEHICARQPTTARLRLRNQKWFPSFAVKLAGRGGHAPPVLQNEIAFPAIPARTVATIDAPATFSRRGLHQENLFVISTRFPFGFFERRAWISIQGEAVIYPALAPSAQAEELLFDLKSEMALDERGLGSDFYRLRPYDLHESARYVDWKSSAHIGQLQVREFAREEGRAFHLFLDVYVRDLSDADRAAFETAVECCAYLVWSLSNESARIWFRTQTHDLHFPEQASVYSILRALALVSPSVKAPIPEPDEDDPHVLFTSRKSAFAAQGWRAARVVEPESPRDVGLVHARRFS